MLRRSFLSHNETSLWFLKSKGGGETIMRGGRKKDVNLEASGETGLTIINQTWYRKREGWGRKKKKAAAK